MLLLGRRYYLNRNSDPASAEKVLASTLLNATEIREDIIEAILNIRGQYTAFKRNVSNTEDNALLAAVIANLTGTSDLLRNALDDGSEARGGLLYLISLMVFQSNYDSTKQYLCCTIPALSIR